MRSTEGYTEWEAGPSKAGATTAASTSTARTVGKKTVPMFGTFEKIGLVKIK